jgi:DinB family protein
MDMDWTVQLVDQLDWHWEHQLRPRMSGISDAEYLWEPVDDAWSVRPRGQSTSPGAMGSGEYTMDYGFPVPTPAPLTTIAWRLAHLIVGVLGKRNAAHFEGSPVDYETFQYAPTAAQALHQLDNAYVTWTTGVRSLGADGLVSPCGSAEGPFASYPMAALVLHINREVIHHGAEIALLRDLYQRLGPT